MRNKLITCASCKEKLNRNRFRFINLKSFTWGERYTCRNCEKSSFYLKPFSTLNSKNLNSAEFKAAMDKYFQLKVNAIKTTFAQNFSINVTDISDEVAAIIEYAVKLSFKNAGNFSISTSKLFNHKEYYLIKVVDLHKHNKRIINQQFFKADVDDWLKRSVDQSLADSILHPSIRRIETYVPKSRARQKKV